jgi:hypothetical protein
MARRRLAALDLVTLLVVLTALWVAGAAPLYGTF